MTGMNRNNRISGNASVSSRSSGAMYGLSSPMSRSVFVKTMGVGMAGLAGMATAKGRVVSATGSVFVVSPSGGDDTANIQSAFNSAVVAGPGSTVQFTAGHFYTSGEIYTEGFDGSVVGAGIGNTIVEAVGEPRTSMFMFIRSDNTNLTVRGMSLDCNVNTTLGYFICDLYGNNRGTVIERVNLEGKITGSSNYFGVDSPTYNTAFGIISETSKALDNSQPGEGVLKIKDCTVKWVDNIMHAECYGTQGLATSGSVTIDGLNAMDVGAFDSWSGGISSGNIYVPMTIMNCNITRAAGLFAIWLSSSENVVITNCTLTDCTVWLGLGANGFSKNISIENNIIERFNAPDIWGIGFGAPLLIEASQECEVTRNTLIDIGNCMAGVRVNGSSGNFVHGNNFARSNLPGFTFDEYGNILTPGCVSLIESSTDNQIVERNFPAGTNMCSQILDAPDLNNEVPGWRGFCVGPSAEVHARIAQKMAEHAQKMQQLGNKLYDKLSKLPGQFGR